MGEVEAKYSVDTKVIGPVNFYVTGLITHIEHAIAQWARDNNELVAFYTSGEVVSLDDYDDEAMEADDMNDELNIGEVA